jgi:hypothetical protein
VGVLVAHVAEAVDRYRAGEDDAFGVDQVVFRYSQAAARTHEERSAEP